MPERDCRAMRYPALLAAAVLLIIVAVPLGCRSGAPGRSNAATANTQVRAARTTAPPPPWTVHADPAVAPIPLEPLLGLNPTQLWHALDVMEFWAIPLDPPPSYYADVDLSSHPALRQSLHELIAGHRVFNYQHPSVPGDPNHVVDTWDIISIADAHPLESGRVLDLYLNGAFDRQDKGPTTTPRYDREHSWPKTLGFDAETILNPAYSDAHHLFAAFSTYNNSRGNNPYGESEPIDSRRKPTAENLGRGGSFHPEPDSSNYSFTDRWQTWIARRGDVARAMFYMDLRYDASAPDEADLALSDDITLIATNRDAWKDGRTAYMGLRSVLLNWHDQDPVDDLERRRNTVVYLFQRNRNPFIDRPEWVGVLYRGQPINPAPAPTATAPLWISELHYDNAGPDEGEFVEISGPAGADLLGWTLVAYNGSGGRQYKAVHLDGVLPNQSDGWGALAFDVPGLQNGSPDGLALVDPAGTVTEFISFGGAFIAADGPALGRLSQDIGVEQRATTPQGLSLHRHRPGESPSAPEWSGPRPASRGVLNNLTDH